MSRFSLRLAALMLPAFALSLVLAGCGKDEKKDTSSTSTEVTQEKPKELKVLEPKGGILKGKIKFSGTPDFAKLNEELKAMIAKQQDKDECMKGTDTETSSQAYRIGDNKQLGNVFVWVIPDSGTFFKVDEKMLKELPKEVEVKQPHCAFIPHCLFHFPQYKDNPKKPRELKPTGQVWKAVNNANISHNTDYKGGSLNSGNNKLLQKGEAMTVGNLKPESSPVLIKCSIHNWMDAYMMVVDTPYYCVSLSDTMDEKTKVDKKSDKFGTYEIKNLPVGKVRVIAWHEKVGYLNKDEGKGQVVEIKEGAPTELDFAAEAK
jgi:hypothetical protein